MAVPKRYERNLGALTEAECALLAGKRVCVVGCGGLGGSLIELLCRVGVGSMTVVDGDVFEDSNLNRQLLATEKTLGKSKAETAAQRIHEVNSAISVTAVTEFLTADNASAIVAGCDIVMDALDNIPARRILANACSEAGIPLVYGAIRRWVAQAAILLPDSGLIDKIYPEGVSLTDKSVLAFTPALCASLQVSLAVKLLTGRPAEAGTMYYADLLDGEFMTIPLR